MRRALEKEADGRPADAAQFARELVAAEQLERERLEEERRAGEQKRREEEEGKRREEEERKRREREEADQLRVRVQRREEEQRAARTRAAGALPATAVAAPFSASSSPEESKRDTISTPPPVVPRLPLAPTPSLPASFQPEERGSRTALYAALAFVIVGLLVGGIIFAMRFAGEETTSTNATNADTANVSSGNANSSRTVAADFRLLTSAPVAQGVRKLALSADGRSLFTTGANTLFWSVGSNLSTVRRNYASN